VDKPEPPKWPANVTLADAVLGARPVWFDGSWFDTPVYDRARLPAGAHLSGPIVVEEAGATTIVPPHWSTAVLEYGELLLERN